MHRKLRLLLIILAVGGIGFTAGFFSVSRPDFLDSRQIRSGTGKLTNPLLECEVAQGTIDSRKSSFFFDLQDFVDKLKKEMKMEETAIYFRDLNNGPVFGINEYETFIPASLLKVPVMISYFKMAENNPGILRQSIPFTAENRQTFNITQQISPEHTLAIGQSYTVNELIEKMIVYSDNESTLLLLQYAPEEALIPVYELLNIDSAIINSVDGKISVKQYSSFFRILFNASYLSQEYSEKALALLVRSTFKDALRAGVPSSIEVAHKFGERLTDGVDQLHDCGIVYFPKHPYLLCLMSRGNNPDTLKQALEKTSNFVYKQINSQYPQ